jgi:hypothetical protein
MPRRVKVEGDLFHGVVPAGAVYVGRGAPGLKASSFMNHHPVGKPCRRCGGDVHTLIEAINAFYDDISSDVNLLERAYRDLAGRDLACWCGVPAHGEPDLCHGAVWLDVVGEVEEDRQRRRFAAGAWAPEQVQVCRPMKDVPMAGGVL